jgi:hypothetical protein
MTKEQILEKTSREIHFPFMLATYLATIEERLEKMEKKTTALETLYTQHEECGHIPTEVKDWEAELRQLLISLKMEILTIGSRRATKRNTKKLVVEEKIMSFIRNLLK